MSPSNLIIHYTLMSNPVHIICTCVSFGCTEQSLIMESGSLQLGKFVTPPIDQGIELVVKSVTSTSRFTFP